MTFVTLPLNLSNVITFPINQLATITPTPFSALQPPPPLLRNSKLFPLTWAPCPFHLTQEPSNIKQRQDYLDKTFYLCYISLDWVISLLIAISLFWKLHMHKCAPKCIWCAWIQEEKHACQDKICWGLKT